MARRDVDPRLASFDVAIVHRRLAHYRLPLYDGIGTRHPDIRLTVYCGAPEARVHTSGVSLEGPEPSYVRRVRNREIPVGRGALVLQPGTVWDIVRRRPDVAVFEGTLLLASSIPLMGWRRLTGRSNVIWLKGWPDAEGEGGLSRAIRRAFLALAEGYIVYGERSVERLVSYGVPRSRVTVAQNTVDVSGLLEPVPSAAPSPDDPRVATLLEGAGGFVLNIGRLVQVKAVDLLLEAWALLQRELRGTVPKLAVVGRGPDEGRLKARARALGLDDSVVFTGPVSDHDAELLFRAARCAVFPGAVGLALNQALAAGRPVVCADEAGPDSELLIHGENGFRVPPGDARSLASAIRTVLDDGALAESLGRRARETVVRRATMTNMIDRFATALRRAAGRRQDEVTA